jgi:hypothetical protein
LECVVAHASFAGESAEWMRWCAWLAVSSDDLGDFGERLFDAAVGMDELEGFAVDCPHPYFEFGSVWGVDDAADFEAENFAGEDAVFTNGVGAAGLDEFGELFVFCWNWGMWEMWCGLGWGELLVAEFPNFEVGGECLGSSGGDAGVAFDDEVDLVELMLLHPQQRGADGPDVVAHHIEGAVLFVDEACTEREVAGFGVCGVEANR